MSGLLGGLVGGLAALLVAGGLYWLGVLPSPRGDAGSTVAPLQAEIDSLNQKIAALEQAPGSSDEDAAAMAIDGAMAGIAENRASLAALDQRLGTFDARLSGIDDALAGAGMEGDTEVIGELRDRVATLEAGSEGPSPEVLTGIESGLSSVREETEAVSGAVATLQNDITALSGRLDEGMGSVNGSIDEMQNAIGAIEQRIGNVEADIDAGAGSRVASAIAASALKSASDRGLPFMNELESYAAVAGPGESVEALRAYAASGVPTPAQLSDRFPQVANRIVASGSGLTPEANIADRLMASARSLVQVRPVGEVAGDDPGAIAARMEVALQGGDLARAIAEWEKLPDPARQVSEGFANDLQARQTLDSLISDVLSGAVGTGEPATNG
jgi:hypothetical protein